MDQKVTEMSSLKFFFTLLITLLIFTGAVYLISEGIKKIGKTP